MKTIKESVSMKNRLGAGQGRDEMEHKEPRIVEKEEKQKDGFYKGPTNQTLKAGHGERKEHEDHHPAVKMSKGGK